MRNIISFCLVIISVSVVAQNQNKKYQGLLWEIKAPNGQVSYLYGTMHVSEKIAFNLSDSFFIALNNTDAVALESNPTEWIPNTFHPRFVSGFLGSPSFSTSTPKGFYQKVFKMEKPKKRMLRSLLAFEPYILNGLQFRQNSGRLDFQEETYLDMFIYQTARKTDKTVYSLEDVQESRLLMNKAEMEGKKEEKKPVSKWLEDLLEDKSYYELINEAYRQQDLDKLDTLEKELTPKAFMKYGLVERNRNMVISLDKLLKQGKTIFVGIGAAHLAGYEGVIEMLRKKGYKLRPVTFERTDFAINKKENFDTTFVNQELKLQKAPDGFFEVLWPNEIYNFPGDNQVSYQIGPEMTNGSYFMAIRIDMANYWNPKDLDYNISVMDSLLFENIPGKILQKEKLKIGDYPALKIKNVTKVGNHQQYLIVSTPIQVIIFKVGGKKNHIQKVGDKIFESIKIKPIESGFQMVKTDFEGISIDFPKYSTRNQVNGLNALYENFKSVGYDPKSETWYALTSDHLFDQYFIETDEFELNRLVEKFAKNHDFEVESKKPLLYQGYQAIDFTLNTKKKINVRGRIIIKGSHFYLLLASSEKKLKPNKVFNSLEFKEPIKEFKYENYKDTVLNANVYACFDLHIDNMVSQYFSRKNKPNENESFKEYYTFYNENKQVVRVKFERFKTFDYFKDLDSFYKEKVDDFIDEKSFEYRIKKKSSNSNLNYCDVVYTDTGSTRGIYQRIMVTPKYDAYYTITTVFDTINGLESYVNEFYKNFSPVDSNYGSSVFMNKDTIWTRYYLSGDSLQQKIARESDDSYYDKIEFSKENVVQILNQLYSKELPENERYKETKILSKVAEARSNGALEFAYDLFLKSADNYPKKLEAMRIIFSAKTPKSIQYIKNIFNKEIPYIAYSYSYGSSLNPFHFDTLKNAIDLFPYSIKLLEDDNFKYRIYSLMAEMIRDTGVSFNHNIYREKIDYLKKEFSYQIRKSKADKQLEDLEEQEEKASNKRNTKSKKSAEIDLDYSIVTYATLLNPYKNEDPEISQMLEEFYLLENNDYLLSIQKLRKINGLPVNKKLIKNFLAKDPSNIVSSINFLTKENLTNLIPEMFQDEIGKAKLGLLLNNDNSYYSYSNYDIEKDTIEYLEKKLLEKPIHKKIIFFKIKKFKSEPDKYNRTPEFDVIAVVYDISPSANNEWIPINQYSKSVDDGSKIQKAIEELIEKAEIEDHKRAAPERKGYGFYDYY